MRKTILSSILGGMCLVGYSPAHSDNSGLMAMSSASLQTIAQNSQIIGQYLENLGFYLGFDISKAPCVDYNNNNSSPDQGYALTACSTLGSISYILRYPFSNGSTNGNGSQQAPANPFLTQALPGTALVMAGNIGAQGLVNLESSYSSSNGNQLFTSDTSSSSDQKGLYTIDTSKILKSLENTTLFSGSAFDQWNIDTSVDVVANPQLSSQSNQAFFQGLTPTSQYLLNFLSLQNDQDCLNTNDVISTKTNSYCMSPYTVMRNAVGTTPPTIPTDISTNVQVIPMLNVETLIGPLQYNTTALTSDFKTFSTQSNSKDQIVPLKPSGSSQLPQAQSQLQQAQNYIRYATSALMPPTSLATLDDYTQAYTAATPTGSDGTTNSWTQEATDSTSQSNRYKVYQYLSSLRTFAAVMSVGVSNLNYIFARRMPNPQNNNISAAASEYFMATHRLMPDPSKCQQNSSQQSSGDPNQGCQSQWQQDINKASPIKLQREMVLLLAEMNYQLYLNRMQGERSLMTLSMLQLMSASTSVSTLNSQFQQTTPPSTSSN